MESAAFSKTFVCLDYVALNIRGHNVTVGLAYTLEAVLPMTTFAVLPHWNTKQRAIRGTLSDPVTIGVFTLDTDSSFRLKRPIQTKRGRVPSAQATKLAK